MQRKIVVAISAIAFMALSVGVAIAYFSYTQRTPLGQFQTGSTEISVTSNTVDAINIIPGGTQMFSYTIENTGTVPVQVRSRLESTWSDVTLDTGMVNGVELVVNRGDGAGFLPVYSEMFGVNQEFYFSDSGNDDALWELGPGESWIVQVTVELHENAGPEYMLATYSVEAIVGVREIGIQIPWPTFE